MNKFLYKGWHWVLITIGLSCAAGIVSGKDTEAVDDTTDIVQPTNKFAKISTAASPAEDVKLDLAKLNREEVDAVSVDLFAARSVHPLPPPPPVAAPSAPPLPFTYMGRMVDGDVVTVFLSMADRDYKLRLNDVVDNTYRVEQIGDDRVIVTYLPLDIQQTLSISRAN